MCLPCLLKLKGGVVVPKVVIIAAAVVNAANALNLEKDIWITSGNDSTHMAGSLHFADKALDIRTKNLTKQQKRDWMAEVKRRLGKDYQVILEAEGTPNEHAHIEHDPVH